MAALTKDRNARFRAQGGARQRTGGLAANAIAFLGGLAAKNAAGWLVPASDIAAIKVVGVFESSGNNTGGAAGAVEVSYVTGLDVELLNAGGAIVQAGKHTTCYVADDQSVTTAAVAANDVLAGIVSEFSATKVWVFVDEALVTAALTAPFDGADMDTAADAQVLGGIPVLHIITVGDVVSGDTDVVLTEKTEVVDCWCQKINGAGAANTAQLKNGVNAISDAMACAVDNAITRPATLDDARTVIAAGGTLRVSHVKAAGTGDLRMFVLGVKRA